MVVARYFGDNFKLHIAHNTDNILKISKEIMNKIITPTPLPVNMIKRATGLFFKKPEQRQRIQ